MEPAANDGGPKSNVQQAYIGPEHETTLQKCNENLRLTENLLRRIDILEQKVERSVTYRIITKVNKYIL